MGAIISLLIIAGVSLIIVRIGSTALMLTGLSWDVANFQAYSAFFGVGFTTAEAEMAVSTPHRRRIIKHLILAGNLGVTAGLGSVVVAFVKADGLRAEMGVLLWILGGMVCVGLLSMARPTRRAVDWTIRRTLKSAGVVHAADFGLLLRLHAGYTISEVTMEAGSPIVGKTLAEAKLGSQGVVVLGIARHLGAGDAGAVGGGHEEYIGTPHGQADVRAGDVLTVYGKPERIAQLLR